MMINKTNSYSDMGGKGYQLFRMSNIFPVPRFFSIMFDDDSDITKESNQKKIIQEAQKLGASLFAIRSSATCEDSEEASFAGMFNTQLNVPLSGIIDAIINVLNSVNNERVKKYCELKRIDYEKIKMRIIVQKQVSSRISGVCFTNSNSTPGKIVIEGVLGLGEMLVSGKVTPDTCLIDRETLKIESYQIGYQDFYLGNIFKINDDNVLHEQEMPFYLRNARKITNEELFVISKIALEIESHLDFEAADIEWAYEDNNLYIIQARPYTGYRKEV